MTINPYQSPGEVACGGWSRPHWFCVLLLLALLLFPPLRCAGDWQPSNDRSLNWSDCRQLDRYWFGRLPNFRPLYRVGCREAHGSNLTVGLGDTQGSLTTFTWQVDWEWFGALAGVVAALGVWSAQRPLRMF